MKRNRIDRASRRQATCQRVLRARRFFHPLLEQFEDRRLLAAVLTVNSPLDTNVRDSVLTFRESILVSNRTLPVATLTAAEQAQVSGTPTSADTDTIGFNIPGSGVQSISTATALPAITDPVVIDGYTQPGASANTLAVGSDAVLLVEVFSTTNQTGLVLSGGNSTVRGLVLNRFFDAVSVVSSNNVIEGNFIGIAADGVTDRDNQFNGIRVTAGSNNLIGGVTPAARNVLGGRGFFSGNYSAQIAIGKASAAAAPVVNTTIRGNYIGINAAGTAPISTASFVKVGVSVGDGVNTIIGGTDADDGTLDGVVHARNVISGNGNGIYAAVFNNGVNSGYLMDGLTIQGNFVGTNATGTSAIANQGFGVFAGEAARSTNLLLGGTAAGAGNVISGNRSSGFIGGALSAVIEGNRVGTDLSGTLDLGNGVDGSAGAGAGGEGVHISLGGTEGPNFQITIGGTTPAARNIISGNAANGVLATGIKSGSVSVQGNYIGTKADGQTPLPNLHNGIEMNRSVVIGGAVAGAPNVIAFNGRTGVFAPSTSAILTVPILGNSIHSNGNIGIDLNASGVSMNDLGDTDTGINNSGQNFPVLTGINAVGSNTVITGRLNSNANSNYRIEFFYNDARDTSGFGEGQTYLGFTDVTTDSSGNVTFVSPTVPGVIPAGRFVTATATKTTTSETSEFSFALASLIVTNTLDSGIGSLREAITLANTFVNFDRDGLAGNDVDPITFAIPASGVQTITPLSALPTIAEAVSIDGYTQPGASPNTLTVGSNAQLLIELNGASAGSSANGLTVSGGGGSTVRGLAVNRFGGSGVELVSGTNVVEGNFLGIDPGGTIEQSNLFAGVRVSAGTNNRIGGTTPQARNVVAGNGSTTGTAQIVVGSSGTVIRGNYIGINAAGTAAVHPTASGNDDGIYVARGVATIIGGNDADDGLVDGVVRAGNVISGNLNGIRIDATGVGATLVDGITIQGNIIGLDATGTQDVGNFADGISAVRAAFTSAASIVQIGGTQPGAGNVISANDGRGFVGSAANLVLEGNRIGTDISGTLNFGNGSQGVHVSLFGEIGLVFQIRVGGTTPAARNIISGNVANGVLVADAGNVTNGAVAIQGNYIGTQADGQSPLPNLLDGIQLVRNATVGGTAAGAGNVIAFNRQRGVNLVSAFTIPVLSNSIFSNGALGNTISHLGIDLSGNGVTPNDPNDGDFGINRLQNFPVFSSAALAAGALTIQYSVPTSTSNAAYPLRIEFFKADADGQEGQTLLGFDTYTAAEAQTVKTFVLTPAVTLAANDRLVATATDSNGNTSEFSASQVLTTANQPPTVNAGPDAVINNFSAFARIGSFADPDANTWTATVNYGDGSGDLPLTLNADKTFALNRSYANEGTFTVTVTINDGVGGIATDTAVVTVNRFTVDTTADNTLTDGLLTLREAIANANFNADLNTIRFNFSATDPRHFYYRNDGQVGAVSRTNLSGVEILGTTTENNDANIPTTGPLAIDPDWMHSWYSIQIASALPAITEAVVIDGFTQAGTVVNSNPVSQPENSVLRIELTAFAGNEFDGLTVAANNSTVRGMSIHSFGSFFPNLSDGVEITGSGNTVAGSHLGVDVSGLSGQGNESAGVFINNGANNFVGGTSVADRNHIADNRTGVVISGTAATGNSVLGSEIRQQPIAGGVFIQGGAKQNVIGGSTAGSGNAIHGNARGVVITDAGTENNRVQGNTIFLNPSGIEVLIGNGNLIGGLTNVPGTAAGNVIRGNNTGITIDFGAERTLVQGNLVGTDATGTAASGSFFYGILDAAVDTMIGGPDSRARNIVSASQRYGIGLQGNGTTVQNNFVGTDITGTADLGNGLSGIFVAEGNNKTIVGNVIAFNRGEGSEGGPEGSGIHVYGGTGSFISANSIFANQGLGIELDDNYLQYQLLMPNDPGDADVGPNNLQNYPVITSVTTGGTTTINGTLNSIANATFRVEFFSSTAADPSGFGEGQTYLGFATVTTDGSGNGSFSFSPAATVPVGQFITSTATDVAGNTSEFGGIRAVSAPPLNQAPTITSNGGGDSASVSVQENTTVVTTVTATDPDAGTTLTYSISGGADAARFTINPSSGALTFVAAPNFETPTDADANNNYLVIVQASDGSLTDSQALTVTVTNANELPAITSNGGGDTASVNVPENTTAVTTVTATDPDAGTTLTYSISGGADAAKFAINPTSGVLTFVTPPNFEAPADADANNNYLVIVQASDGSLTDSQSLTVTVTNINEPPVITSNGGGDSASVSVPENTSAVTTVTAMDPDAGTTIVYSISGGADAAKFAINPVSGALTFVVAPDFEAPTDADTNNSYLVVVQASDGSLIDSQSLTVTVTNANELPVITSNGGSDSASVSVPENTMAVTTVAATDPDAGTTLTYSISGGADAAKFAINPASGALTFLSPPNFESPTDVGANNVYDVVVAASDGSALDTQILTVNVVNANEPPVITSNGAGDSANVSVPENTTGVTTVTATDPDAGTTLTYSISGGADAAKFAINPSSGALAFIATPDFEAPTDADANNTYLVTVQASDGSLADSQTLTVTVTNANESPVITSNGGGVSANISVPENTTAITTVTATDPDAGATLTYSIIGGEDAAKFTINAATGVLTFATAPNFESPTDVDGNNVYDVIVQVSDGSLLDTQAISVTVTDVAEAAYSISGKVFKDVTGNGKSADDLPWSASTPVTLNLYNDVNGDGMYQSGDTLVTSTATGSGGVYNFVAPAEGKYLIKEVVPSDYVRTFPVLSDYAAVNLTGTASSGNDWYNAEKCNLCVVTNVSYVINHGGVLTTVTDLRGNTHEGDIVTANFTVTATHQVTLVTYNAPGPVWDPVTASQQTVFDFHTATFTPGSHSLTVDIPKNFYQVDLVCGAYINQLGPAGSNIFYSAQNRLISADNGGVNALNAPAIDLALSTSVSNANPLLGSDVVITVMASNAAGWSAATGVRVKDALPAGLTFVSATASQGTYNSSTGEWNLVNPLNSGATATLTITATVATAGEKKNAAQVTAAGAPDIDSTPNNDSSPSTAHNEDDDDTISIVPQLWTKYFVVNDSSTGSTREKTFEYASDGTSVENYQLSSGNTAPRGAATTAAGNKVWVIDANKMVYVYDAAGALLGSWSAGGLASNSMPEGIATNGTDIWIVDAVQDKVFKYANAASRTSGSQSAASSFALNSGNKNPKDIVASGTNLWVVDDSSTDKVFKYTLAGACVGSWTIAGGGGSPTGITLDPANVNHLWIVDKSTDRVYQFNAAASRTSGSQSAASSFQLANGNTGPEGIADPPPASKQVAAFTSARSSEQISTARAFDVALLAVSDELNGLSGGGRKRRQ